ncbi:C-C chemokine receptor type 3-like [Engraulis encrasicolus]|uniref:C-C chemokine receptor type 3-like n=1 Tax=Engraulis encrasicolus TaxID=184585 RepID=UPI002FD13467
MNNAEQFIAATMFNNYNKHNVTPVSSSIKTDSHELSEMFANTTLNYRPYENGALVSACIVPDVKYFYYTIFTLSILGNGLLLFVLMKFDRGWTPNSILMSNLLGSNLVFTITLPTWASYLHTKSTFSPTLCKLVGMATYMGFHSTVLFLTLVTIHRYLAVVHAVAMHNQQHKNRYAVVASVVVWLICGVAGVISQVFRQWENGLVCVDELDPSAKPFVVYLHFVAFFLLPLLVVVYCCVRVIIYLVSARISSQHSALLTVSIILLIFFACWTPHSIMKLVRINTPLSCNDGAMEYAYYITKIIAYLFFCINPVFYAFLKRKFKNYVCAQVCRYFSCL